MTLAEIMQTARSLLPDMAEGDAKLATGEIKPEDHPASRVMEELRAKAVGEGKDQFAFLGRLIPTDRQVTVDDLMRETPVGELEEGGKALRSSILGNRYREQLATGLSGSIPKGVKPDKFLANILENINIRATKSAKAPIDDLAQMLKLRGAQKPVVQSYEGVLERQASKRMARIGNVVKALTTGKASTAAQLAAVAAKTPHRKPKPGEDY